MDLVQGRSARQRNDFVLRLGCWMVTLSMVCSLVIQPPKAKAIVAEASLATSVIWAFMQSAGITFNGTGMNSSSWAESIEPYLREFTEATDSAAKSFWSWLGYDGAADFIKALSWSKITHPSTMPFPSVTIPPAVAKKLARFTVWFAKKVGLASGGESKPVVSISGGTRLKLSNGQSIVLGSCVNPDSSGPKFYEPGTVLFTVVQDMYDNYDKYSWLYTFSNGYSLKLFFVEVGKVVINADLRDSKGNLVGRNNDSSTFTSNLFNWGEMYYDAVGLAVADDGNTITPITRVCKKDDQYKGKWVQTWHRGDYWCKGLTLNDLESFKTSDAAGSAAIPGALSPIYDDTEEKATIITIPGLDTEIAGINELLQAILDKLAANELTTSATIAQQPTPEQPDEEKPDLDSLGLPALGTALMTRFPFSIPWDVVRGIKLLAAPAEAPYWEVDFLAPIAGRVGGWKGSTKVVIDMGQYEIIGQLCRWTSTIGFCLVLAAGTKKLIWTA